MQAPDQLVLDHLLESALPSIGVPRSKVSGILFYGSRAEGTARADSDHDFLVVAEDTGLEYVEHHGLIQLGEKPAIVELRAYAPGRLIREATTGPLYRCRAFKTGIIIDDSRLVISEAREIATRRITGEIADMKREILSQDPELFHDLLRIAYTGARSILASRPSARREPARNARFFEYFLDFYVYVQFLRIARRPALAEEMAPELIENLLFARGKYGARFLDASKHAIDSWFRALLEEVAEENRLENIMDAMDASFSRLFGQRLWIGTGETVQVAFVEKSEEK